MSSRTALKKIIWPGIGLVFACAFYLSNGETTVAHSQKHKHTHKLKGPVEISLQAVGERRLQVGESFLVRAEIQSTKDLDSLRLQWDLSRNLELIRGAVSEQLSLKADEPMLIEIEVQAKAAGLQRIQLKADGEFAGSRFSQYALLPPPQVETVAEDQPAAQPQEDSINGQSLDKAIPKKKKSQKRFE